MGLGLFGISEFVGTLTIIMYRHVLFVCCVQHDVPLREKLAMIWVLPTHCKSGS